MPETPSALVLSGTGRYADPWHPFAETTARIVELLEEAGYTVVVAPDVDERISSDEPAPDLLVVNVGLPRDGGVSPAAEAEAGLAGLLRSGTPLLAVHVSSTSFTDSLEWETALGGRWIRGVSMHPEQDETRVQVRRHALTAGLSEFTINDERYSFLRVSRDVDVLVTHEHDDEEHPIVWVREANAGFGRAAYDALGHDSRSFDSPEHRELLRRLIAWVGAPTP